MSTTAKSLDTPKGKGEMPQVYNNYIGGRWVKAKSGETFPSVNPANVDEVVGHFAASGPEDVKAAVDAAAEAFKEWRHTAPPQPPDLILKAANILEKRKEELATIMTREMGKVIKEARGDVQEAIDMAKYMAGEGRRMFGHTVPSELRDKFAMAVRAPLGVVGVITP